MSCRVYICIHSRSSLHPAPNGQNHTEVAKPETIGKYLPTQPASDMRTTTAPTPTQSGKWVISEFGPPSVLKWQPSASPRTPSNDEALVNILVAGASGADNLQRVGGYPDPRCEKPGFTPGYDFVGDIVALGADVPGSLGLSVGDRVACVCTVGGHATDIVLPADRLLKLKEDDDPIQMCALPLNYMTAWGLLKRSGVNLTQGASILIGAASSGVGVAVAQIVRAFDLGLTMYGTCSPSKFDFVKSLGVTPLDRHDPRVAVSVRSLTDGRGVDVAYDPVGSRQSLDCARAAAKENGRVVCYGVIGLVDSDGSGIASDFDPWKYAQESIPGGSAWAVTWDYRLKDPDLFAHDFAAVAAKVRENRLRPVICKLLPLSEAVQSHELLASGKDIRGKMEFVVDYGLAQANEVGTENVSAHEHTVLITAANGNIGSALVPTLLSEPRLKLILPTTNPRLLRSKFDLGATSNGIVEEGSVRDPIWVQNILTNYKVDFVFLCLAGTDELMTSLNFLDAMERAGCVRHLIYVSGCSDLVSDKAIKRLLQRSSCMHLLIKSTFEQKLAYANLPWQTTVLGPSIFFNNDLRSKAGMLERGVFNEPLGPKGTSRVSLWDVALAVRNIICDPKPKKWAGRKIMIGSKHMYSGGEIADLWSRATGRQIKMMGCDDESLTMVEKFLEEKTGRESGWGRDIRLMYEFFARDGFGMTEDDYKVQVDLLGRRPEDYGAWVKREAATWIDVTSTG